MPRIIDLPKPQRVLKEQQASQDLYKAGKPVTQQDIYQQAYGNAYPVFSEDYGLPRIQETLKAIYTGDTQNKLIRPKKEAKYANKVSNVLSGIKDPLTQQALKNQIFGIRSNAYDTAIGNRLNAALFGQQQANQNLQNDYQYQSGLEQAAAAQAQHDQELQDYLWKAQVDNAYARRSGSGGGSAPSYSIQKVDTLDESGNPVSLMFAVNPKDPNGPPIQIGAFPGQPDTATPGSLEDRTNVAAAIAGELQSGANPEEVKKNLIAQGYNPNSFQYVFDSVPKKNPVIELGKWFQGILGQ